jgi:hypothetical protein
MTAPFNPTELARKWAEEILHPIEPSRSVARRIEGSDSMVDVAAYNAKLDALTAIILSAFRDLIAQSGMPELARDVILNGIYAHPKDAGAMCQNAESLRRQAEIVQANLRSITEAERGGAE